MLRAAEKSDDALEEEVNQIRAEQALLGIDGGQTRKESTRDLETHAASTGATTEDDKPPVRIRTTGHDKYGFCNESGSIVIEPRYSQVGEFSEGLAPVSVADGESHKWGYIDADGTLVIPADYKAAESFREGIALVQTTRGPQLIDQKGATPFDLKCKEATSFSYGLAAVFQPTMRPVRSGWGFIDKTGSFVIPQDRGIMSIRNAEEGLAPIQTRKKSHWGFFDVKERTTPISPQFASVGGFSEGFAAATFDDHYSAKWGFINRTGQFVISPEYSKVRRFSDGLVAVKDIRSWTFVSPNGVRVFNHTFDDAQDFSEGVAAVKKNDVGWGYIDRAGEYVIEPQFDYAEPIRSGIAVVGMYAGRDESGAPYSYSKYRYDLACIDLQGQFLRPFESRGRVHSVRFFLNDERPHDIRRMDADRQFMNTMARTQSVFSSPSLHIDRKYFPQEQIPQVDASLGLRGRLCRFLADGHERALELKPAAKSADEWNCFCSLVGRHRSVKLWSAPAQMGFSIIVVVVMDP
jgi:hypothetical protein